MQWADRRKTKLKIQVDEVTYNHSLQFYYLPPVENISLEEFEEFAVARLRALRLIESTALKQVKGSPEYSNLLNVELRKLDFAEFTGGLLKKEHTQTKRDVAGQRRMDHISHFILRLAYCRSEELRRWFINQEVDLFKFRFSQLKGTKEQAEFITQNDLNYTPISAEEKKSMKKLLEASTFMKAATTFDGMSFYKVPFTDVLELVSRRRVYLKAGFAYVSSKDLISIISGAFRAHLSHALTLTCRALPNLEEDNRLLPLLNGLHNRYVGEDYSYKQSTGQVTPKMTDGLSKTSYPLCMRQLHESLRSTHHMKHWGRLQYGLFVKAIGMSLEDALNFWREEFTKQADIDGDKFERRYAYGIRYNYGKEGKRADYTPYSCIRIITSNFPGVGDSHGCPFRHNDMGILKQKLQSYNISTSGAQEIVELATNGHYQIACTKYFELTHSGTAPPQGAINHPNQYFEDSQTIITGVKPESAYSKKNAARNQQASQFSSPSSAQSTQSQSAQQQTTPSTQSQLEPQPTNPGAASLTTDDGFEDIPDDLINSLYDMDDTMQVDDDAQKQ